MFQLCFVYWFTSAWKWNPVWTTEGSAVYYALSLDQFAKPLGSLLLQYPTLLRVLSHATYALELLGPFLVLAPFWNAQIRLLMVLSFVSFHTGIGLSMALGNFPWICIAAWLIFVPTLFWDRWIPAPGVRAISFASRVTAPVVRFFRRWSLPAPPRPLGLIPNAVVLSLMLLVFAGSVGALPFMQFVLPQPLVRIALTLNIRQRWAMFAPYPSHDDGWYVTEGTLRSGKIVDVWNGGAPTERKPADVMETYRDSKWRKYLTNSWVAINKPYRPYFALYLCRKYNLRHPDDEMQSIVIDYMLEETPPPGQPVPAPKKVELWRQKCSDPPPAN
jgi:hypothetical protein